MIRSLVPATALALLIGLGAQAAPQGPTPEFPAPGIVRGTLVAMETVAGRPVATVREQKPDGSGGQTWRIEFPNANPAPGAPSGHRIGEQVSAAGFRALACEGECRMRAGGLNYLSDGTPAFAGMRSSINGCEGMGPGCEKAAQASRDAAAAAARATTSAPGEGAIVDRSPLTNSVERAPAK